MKLLFWALVFFFVIPGAWCQKHERVNILSISAGVGFPVSGYAATDLKNSSSGFAKPGEYVSISWSKLVSEKIGYTINLSGQRNAVDEKAMAEEFATVKINTGFFGTSTPGIPVSTSGSYYPNWNFKKSSWLLASLQGGLYSELPLSASKNFILTAKLTAGVIYAKLPDQEGQSLTDTSFVSMYQSKGSAFGFAYTIGTGITYRLDKKTVVLLNLNYWGSGTLTFKDVKGVVTKQNNGIIGGSINQMQYTDDATQAFKSTSASLGIGIQL